MLYCDNNNDNDDYDDYDDEYDSNRDRDRDYDDEYDSNRDSDDIITLFLQFNSAPFSNKILTVLSQP